MGFKFNFSSEDDTVVEVPESRSLDWLPAAELKIENSEYEKHSESRFLKTKTITLGTRELLLRDRRQALVALRLDQNIPSHTSNAEFNRTDLEPAKYEGGLKVWECTHDLGSYLDKEIWKNLEGKTVIDLGCGSGAIGILSLLAGASKVVFQDYNIEVLKHWTVVNIAVNTKPPLWDRCRFWSGDWGSFRELCNETYDFVLMSEVIYNPENYDKVIDFLVEKLAPNGRAYLAAKSYYFGLGGSIQLFGEALKQKSSLTCKTVFQHEMGVQREIIEISKTLNK